MKLELKAIQVALFASDETYCFSANLYVDGKKAAVVGNEGHGGCNYERFDDPEVEKRVRAHFAAMPEVVQTVGSSPVHTFQMQPDLESWCGEQVEQFLVLREAKKHARKAAQQIPFVEAGLGEGEYGVFRLPNTPANVERVTKQLAKQGRKAYFIQPAFILEHPSDWLEQARLRLEATAAS